MDCLQHNIQHIGCMDCGFLCLIREENCSDINSSGSVVSAGIQSSHACSGRAAQGIKELFKPAYIETYNKGLLKKKAEQARKILASCVLCPRQCKVDRLSGETGVCKTGARAMVSSYNAHFGEEAPLVGQKWFRHNIFYTLQPSLCFLSELRHKS